MKFNIISMLLALAFFLIYTGTISFLIAISFIPTIASGISAIIGGIIGFILSLFGIAIVGGKEKGAEGRG